MIASNQTPNGRRNRPLFQFLVTWGGLVYIISVALWIAVAILAPNPARSFKILGLSLNIGGAITALAPRAFRGMVHFSDEQDTIAARWGMTLLALGFIQQLVGNLLS